MIYLFLDDDNDEEDDDDEDDGNRNIPKDTAVILWWTPFGTENKIRKCEKHSCYFTNNRVYKNHSNLKGVLFYASNLKIYDLPIPRGVDVRWALLHEESPRNCLFLTNYDALSLFNYSSTFSRYSDVPLTLMYLTNIKHLTDTKYYRSVEEKNKLIDQGLASVVYIQSNCDTVNDRDSYISELMKYIKIDSYGSCLNNKKLPDNLKYNYIDNLDSHEFKMFVGQYKFTLAFENAVCHDYISEKLWRPLVVGSVPIYYGSPSFKDWLPNNHSAISVNDFSGPKQLAEFINYLSINDDQYKEYLSHKLLKNSIKNSKIINKFIKKSEIIFYDYVKLFECSVCEKLYDNKYQTLNIDHYNCPKPKSIFNNNTVLKNWWIDSWNYEKCLAKLMHKYVLNNSSINYDKFNNDKQKC
ncbi:alpha-(1,3)-fucosyltransferase 10 isoform X2 [Aphidius gifuensis]|uniref:alpha-(1,3)-fucosyltransferase 10 isoform X2 n=1 Tax=Aphidius gifuensis TaxID=684658 RepID=UPI001CDCEC39|nr:alpha-(1,3)-fucosyltransferase 10 isoform X2 [Aphidius gifuensis]